jgi:hypothetical protein
MMHFKQFLEETATAAGDEIIEFDAVQLGRGAADRLAAKILLHVITTYPEHTHADIEEALGQAIWWLNFNAAMVWARRNLETPAAEQTALALDEEAA